MDKIHFYGPLDDLQGPGIKNRITLEYLSKFYDIKIFDTFKTSFFNRVKFILNIIFTRKECLVGVSTRGRKLLYPILNIKKKISKDFHFSLIIINGYISNEIDALSRRKKKAFIEAIEKADSCFVELDAIKEQLKLRCPNANIITFPNFKEDKYYLSSKKEKEKIYKLVFLARVDEIKGIDTIIKVVKNIKKNRDILLDVYGPISNNAQKYINEISDLDYINYKGIAPNENCINILSQYDIYVFPSKHKREGFPATILEAFIAGLPVIASDVAFNKYLISNGQNGYIYKTEEELERDIIKLMENPDLCNQISSQNMKIAEQYRTSIVFDRFLKDFAQRKRG